MAFFVEGVRRGVQFHATHLTHRTPTQDNCTVKPQAIRYNFTCLRMGAQERQKSPAGVMSPATPYKSK